MSAIPTLYRGIKFRSRLEARWAEFFDLLNVEWRYEPQGYAVGGVSYLPDFWLPTVWCRQKPGGVFFEVKPETPTAQEQTKARMLSSCTGRPVVIVSGGPKPPEHEYLYEFTTDWEDDGLSFGRCAECGTVNVGFYSSDKQCGACALGLSDPYDSKLRDARQQFQQLARWRAA